MPLFDVDDDLAALVEKLAKPKPFEHLTFNVALRRVLLSLTATGTEKSQEPDILDELLKEAMEQAEARARAMPKKAPSPNVAEWVASVPDLSKRKGLTTWKAICDALKIETAGDSARRRLKNWVRANRPEWPPVPTIE